MAGTSQHAGAGPPARPSVARQAAPWVLAGAILAYMFHKVDFAAVWAHLRDADAGMVITAYLVYCAVYYITDVLSFHRAYNRFNVAISLAEVFRLRFASYAVQAMNGALTEILSVLYMYRVKRVPVLHSASSAGFVYFNETAVMALLLFYCAFFLPEPNRIDLVVPPLGASFWRVFQATVVAALGLVLLWAAFWRTGMKDLFPGIRDSGVLMAFKQARVRDYAEVFCYRLLCNLVSVGANILILKAMGIEAPLALLFASVPLMVSVAYWPVSAGGFGGPQLVAHFLLKGHASEAEVLAYSLVWSALFFLTRTLTGVPFIRPVYRAAFPERDGSGGTILIS